ncbi:MAG: glycosyltransferase family 2 protein, partial [Colwellia sp.]
MNKINVLLSHYNGSKFLRQQLQSIFNQNNVEVTLNIRDDGSTDSLSLKELNNLDVEPSINFSRGKNVGVVSSFFQLLADSDSCCEYFSFCDQDDVWVEGKLNRAVNELSKIESKEPAIYFSSVEFVDENLQRLGVSRHPKQLSFNNALVENVAYGCTLVMNKAARNLILKHVPKNATMHDSWVYLVVSAFGRVIYDPAPSVQYRQHGGNVVGGQSNLFTSQIEKIMPFIMRLREDKIRLSDQVEEFLGVYGSALGQPKYALANNFVSSKSSFLKRIKFVLSGECRREYWLDDLVY